MKLSLEVLRRMIRQRLFRGEEEEVDPYAWLVPFVNLMTILMIFFLALYAFSYMNKKVYEKAIQGISMSVATTKEQKEKLREVERAGRFENFVWNNALEKFVELDLASQKIVIRLKEPILFNKGQAALKSSAASTLAEVGLFIRDTEGKVRVEGYTDNLPVKSGEFKSNWELAAARAYSIMDYLITKEGIEPGRFAIMSYAQNRPVAPNDTDENRAKNRRIEINITKKRDSASMRLGS